MSIKVGVRVRPFNTREKDKESTCAIEMIGNQTIIRDEEGTEKKFTFDHSFWSHDGYEVKASGYLKPKSDKYADQRYVFDAVGKQILDNAWEGYHCCLFAYGQTGSGKSYSMVGFGDNKGIVPISCEEIFRRIKANTDIDKSYELQVSMLEIYNEKVQDLFIPVKERPSGGLKVRESKIVGIFVEGLTKYPVQSYEEISNKMEEGYENRTIGSTLMNATSSRAHTIVTIEFRQCTMISGRKSEKLSMINLVDLAGSERTGSTGATGDRLKEGCNINKSLLILGNVINVLADKAIGKKKDMLPPYRDSALTRILQNALGGNSKTVMVCALSPASINYEETLSTLRYADRAKKIQNKAVINESEHDKTVRMLREENNGLKKLIEDLQKKLLGNNGIIGEEDKAAFLELKDQYDVNQKVMEDMQKTFQERLTEAKSKEKEFQEEKVDINAPHLIVLNEDPQLSHKIKYSLKTLPIYVGRKHGNPTPQIILSGIAIKQNHAIFTKEKDEIKLKPNDPEAYDYIFINGKKLQTENGQILQAKDRIVFGTNMIMIFMKKSNGKDIYDIDWENSQIELQKEFEANVRKREEENDRRKKEEFALLKKDLEEKYEKEKGDYQIKLKKQMEEYENKMKVMMENAERKRIESERKNVEQVLKQKIEFLEGEKSKKKRELELREKNERKDRDYFYKNEKLENTLMNIVKKITKFNIIIEELKRNITLDVFLSKDYLNGPDEPPILLVRVENYEEGTVYYWNTDTFHNRYDLMKELFNKFNDEEFDIFNIKQEEDPLWDEPTQSVLGYAFFKLEPLASLMNNLMPLFIISPNGSKMGVITLDMVPHDDYGEEFDEVPDDPYELVGQPLNFGVYIKDCQELPDNFCRGIQIEYVCFADNKTYKTKIYNSDTNNANDKNNNKLIPIKENFEHQIEYLTKEDIDYLLKEKTSFKVLAYESVEKKGKTSKEILNAKMNELRSSIMISPNKEIDKTKNDFARISQQETNPFNSNNTFNSYSKNYNNRYDPPPKQSPIHHKQPESTGKDCCIF